MENKAKRIFLKPCPICGSAPILKSYQCDPWGDGGGYATAYYYQCSGCEYVKTQERLSTSYHDNEQVKEKTKEVWNDAVDDIKGMIISNYLNKEGSE